MLNNHPVKARIIKFRKRLREELEEADKDCVKNAYDTKKDDWNPEHFKYCEGDLITSKLDLLDELEK